MQNTESQIVGPKKSINWYLNQSVWAIIGQSYRDGETEEDFLWYTNGATLQFESSSIKLKISNVALRLLSDQCPSIVYVQNGHLGTIGI